jgi:hypothetical protein
VNIAMDVKDEHSEKHSISREVTEFENRTDVKSRLSL